ncbi:MAG: glycosyltransferase family 2 protein [Flavobacteriales bacterium]
MVRVAVIIPCYNESSSVLPLFDELKSIVFPEKYQVVPIFIDDCSRDNTLQVLLDHQLSHLALPVNLGIGGAVQTGIKYAYRNGFDYAVQMDGDGQHPPFELQKIIDELEKGEADLVIGSRFIGDKSFRSSFMRRRGIGMLSGLINLLSGVRILDCTSGYRGFNCKAMALAADYYPDEYPEPESIIYFSSNGLKIKEISVLMRERQGGSSSIYGWKSVYYMLKVSLAMIFNYLKHRNAHASH